MSAVSFIGAVELGLIYGLVAIGLFISYRILNLADLTTEGSFTLGAVVSVMFTFNGYPWLGILFAVLAGGAAGLVTAFLQTKLKIQSILAGILTMTALYSINLRVMDGKASMNLIDKATIFTPFRELFGSYSKLVLLALVALAVIIMIVWFMNTQIGIAVRATGDNENMVRSSSISVSFMKTTGLIIANAFIGLSGGILAQYQQAAEVNMGVGVVVIGLASLIIGEVLIGNLIAFIVKRRNILISIISTLLGAVIYRIIIALVLQYSNSPALKALKITASDLRLISSVIVILAISYPVLKDLGKKIRKRLYPFLKKQIKKLGSRRNNDHA